MGFEPADYEEEIRSLQFGPEDSVHVDYHFSGKCAKQHVGSFLTTWALLRKARGHFSQTHVTVSLRPRGNLMKARGQKLLLLGFDGYPSRSGLFDHHFHGDRRADALPLVDQFAVAVSLPGRHSFTGKWMIKFI